MLLGFSNYSDVITKFQIVITYPYLHQKVHYLITKLHVNARTGHGNQMNIRITKFLQDYKTMKHNFTRILLSFNI